MAVEPAVAKVRGSSSSGSFWRGSMARERCRLSRRILGRPYQKYPGVIRTGSAKGMLLLKRAVMKRALFLKGLCSSMCLQAVPWHSSRHIGLGSVERPWIPQALLYEADLVRGFNSDGQTRERFMDIGEDKRDAMRYTIMVLITLTAFCLLLPGEGADIKHVLQDNLSSKMEPPETGVILTSSMASFMNDSWTPSSFVPDVYTASTVNKKGFVANSSNAIYDFLNGSWTPPSAVAPIYTATAAGQNNTVAWSEESIYQFLQDNWTPDMPLIEYQSGMGYAKHQMS